MEIHPKRNEPNLRIDYWKLGQRSAQPNCVIKPTKVEPKPNLDLFRFRLDQTNLMVS